MIDGLIDSRAAAAGWRRRAEPPSNKHTLAGTKSGGGWRLVRTRHNND